MTKFEENLKLVKQGLKSLIKEGAEEETVKSIAALDALADELASEHKKTTEKYSQLQSDYIDVVKHTSFKPNGTEEDGKKENPKTFEEILKEKLKESEE